MEPCSQMKRLWKNCKTRISLEQGGQMSSILLEKFPPRNVVLVFLVHLVRYWLRPMSITLGEE